jgi:hypothetical protein
MKTPKEILGYFEHMRLYEEATRPGYCPFCKVRYSRTFWGPECPAQNQPQHSALISEMRYIPPGVVIQISGMKVEGVIRIRQTETGGVFLKLVKEKS